MGHFYFIIHTWVAGIAYYYARGRRSFIESLTVDHLVVGIGLFGLWNFIGHPLMSEQIAQSIGWTSNGFQQELGWVSLGIGIAGLLCFWIRDRFWWATAIPFSTFLLGAAGIHLVEIMEKGNLNPGNTWIIMPDLLMP